MDSGGGAWPKDLNIKQVVENTAQQLGLPTLPSNLTLHSLLGIDPAMEGQLRQYLATAYGHDPKSAALFPTAREDVELSEPMGSLKHTLRESPRAGDASAHVPWAQDEEIHQRLYELLNEQKTPAKGQPGTAGAAGAATTGAGGEPPPQGTAAGAAAGPQGR